MKRKMILMVDDDKDLLEELESVFGSCGYEAKGISDVSAVVKTAEELHPDVILLDMKMAGKSGFQIADDLRHFPATAEIPIIAMTGHFTEKQHMNFMRSLGIRECVLKPFDPKSILVVVKQFMNNPGFALPGETR